LQALIDSTVPEAYQSRFKHLCGEYCTATAFALWLGASILKKQVVPDITKIQKGTGPARLRTVLIVNQYMGKSYTFILLNSL
jgi:hypothetical protein